MEWGEILNIVLPIAGTLIAGLLGWGLVYLRKKVKETENKIDDAVVEALDKAINESKSTE